MVGRSLSGLVAGQPSRGPWEWTDDTEMACNLVATPPWEWVAEREELPAWASH